MVNAGVYTVKFGTTVAALTQNDLWESLTFTNTLDLNVDTAQISFPNSQIPLPLVGQRVVIYRDGVAKWAGLAASVNHHYSADQQHLSYTLNCLSNKVFLKREIFSRN